MDNLDRVQRDGKTAWTESSLGDARGFPWRLLHPLGTMGWDGHWTESSLGDARGFPWRLLHPLGTTGWDGQLGQSLAWGMPGDSLGVSCIPWGQWDGMDSLPRDSLGVPCISWGPGDGQPLAVTTYLSDPCTLTPRVAWDDVLGCPEDQQSDKPTPSDHLGMSLHILTHPRMASMAVLPSWDVLGRIISMTSPMSGMSLHIPGCPGMASIALLPSWDVLGRISSMTSPCPTYPRMASIAVLPSWDVLGRISSMTSPCPTYPRMASIAVLPFWDVLGRCLACPYISQDVLHIPGWLQCYHPGMSWEGSAV